jgi:hypothetical protein
MLVARAYDRVRCTCRPGRGVYGLDAVQHRDISGYVKAEVLCLARGEIGQEQAEDEPGGPRQHENSQLAGRFRRVWQVLWQVLGSNQRRLSRRFYSPLAPPESPR